jgi:hypothetical protein
MVSVTVNVTSRVLDTPHSLSGARDPSLQAVGTRRLDLGLGAIVLLAHHEHRTRGTPNDMVGDGPQKQLAEPTSRVCPDDEEIGLDPRGRLQNLMTWVTGREVAKDDARMNSLRRCGRLFESSATLR